MKDNKIKEQFKDEFRKCSFLQLYMIVLYICNRKSKDNKIKEQFKDEFRKCSFLQLYMIVDVLYICNRKK